MRTSFRPGIRIAVLCVAAAALSNAPDAFARRAPAQPSERAEPTYARYVDPEGRFSFEYPSTMNVRAKNPNEVMVGHPEATLRISVYVDKRPPGSAPRVKPLLRSFKERLRKDVKNGKVLVDGEPEDKDARQGYVVCLFKDSRGINTVQLVHYVAASDRLLQMIVSDRPKGFTSLKEVIRKIHRSLTIMKPDLK